MTERDVRDWFGEYLDAYAACGRGDRETSSLLAYYGVPLVITSDAGCFALTAGEQVIAAIQPQIDAMRAAGYARSELRHATVTVLNARSATYRGTFSRQRADGSEINQLTVTYVITDGAAGRRISVLAVHGG